MIEKNISFHLIYWLTFPVIWLLSYEGKTSITHAPVLSNLKTLIGSYNESDILGIKFRYDLWLLYIQIPSKRFSNQRSHL